MEARRSASCSHRDGSPYRTGDPDGYFPGVRLAGFAQVRSIDRTVSRSAPGIEAMAIVASTLAGYTSCYRTGFRCAATRGIRLAFQNRRTLDLDCGKAAGRQRAPYLPSDRAKGTHGKAQRPILDCRRW